MDEILSVVTPARVGLVVNLIGTIVLALSVRKNIDEAHQLDEKGRPVYLAVYYPNWFGWGLVALGLGFYCSWSAEMRGGLATAPLVVVGQAAAAIVSSRAAMCSSTPAVGGIVAVFLLRARDRSGVQRIRHGSRSVLSLRYRTGR